jgi:hypothetical protein
MLFNINLKKEQHSPINCAMCTILFQMVVQQKITVFDLKLISEPRRLTAVVLRKSGIHKENGVLI